jgi:hypothetical protein
LTKFHILFAVTFGKNAVSRSSKDAFLTSKDELTTKQIIKLVDEALEGKTTLYKEEVSTNNLLFFFS